ncbi:hypothetical protein Y032_0049g1751 [Ancylostoma ceylanicum]|uniref:Uncharacterized protein n=1 Tax=Ancylostoma ceylanicum TaxID=53326 RepID=A0A016U9Y7_9BILA|nr:hypothetical protein Y032_0049g1751 [Ancylostoma ceylanicum]
MVAFLTLSFSFGQLCGYFLILKAIFDVLFWIMIVLSVDLYFGELMSGENCSPTFCSSLTIHLCCYLHH